MRCCEVMILGSDRDHPIIIFSCCERYRHEDGFAQLMYLFCHTLLNNIIKKLYAHFYALQIHVKNITYLYSILNMNLFFGPLFMEF